MHPHDRRSPLCQKKKLEQAAETFARSGRTAHPQFKAFFLAQHINQQSGGAVIAPWDIEPGYTVDEWSEAARVLSEVPSLKARSKAFEQVFEKARQSNKHYNALHARRVH